MDYTVNQLAKISGVSRRTLHYYDEIGLLKADRISSNGYRIYGYEQLCLLQQILFYRELDVGLDEIKEIITSPQFDKEKALKSHLSALNNKKLRLEALIENVQRSISELKGEFFMSNSERFDSFKQKLIDENEEKYGSEIRKKYSDELIDASNQKIKGMTEEQWSEQDSLSKEIAQALKLAVSDGNPSGELAQKVCELHKKWICLFWKDGTYSKTAHLGLAEMYVSDQRFKEYYEKICPGATEFLLKALKVYCSE